MKKKLDIELFFNNIDYRFKDVSILEHAFSHSSFIKDKLDSNERLEFLGDRVLGLSVAKLLYEMYPNDLEGDLAVKHASLVSSKTLAIVSESMKIPLFIKLSIQEKRRQGNKNKNILADCCEAVLGAVFLDSNFDEVYRIVKKFWKNLAEKLLEPVKDYKTLLQEYSQKKFHICPMYDFVSQKGPDHNPLFEMKVIVKHFECSGVASNKKDAEQEAAKNMLSKFNSN